MVARISSGSSPKGAVYYNEVKVNKGEAERLAVRNYVGVVKPVDELTLELIAGKLERQAELNERVSKPTFHASLSLSPGEKPSPDELLALADAYMSRMGYNRQPYVVYQHFDTDHSHIHIVSVRVDEQGKKLSDSHERQRSNEIRKQLEKEFGLQAAERTQSKALRAELQPVEIGKGDIKREVSAIVNGVLSDFTFSSFSQFNQLLGIYNLKATEVPLEGKPPGLVYSVVDRQNAAQSVPFKASSLPYQPTLETINRRINAGKKKKGDRVGGVRKVAHNQLSQSKGWDEFQQRLSRSGVELVPHLGKEGNLFGVSFIDVRSRTIYTGSELGKSFTAGALKEAFGQNYSAPTQRPTAEQPNKVQTPTHLPNPQREESSEKESMDNLSIIRQLLYALGEETNGQESDFEIKKMNRKTRKL